MAIRPLPTPAEIGRLLGQLFGRGVTVRRERFDAPDGAQVYHVGYEDTDGHVGAVLVGDGAAAASLGAALLLIPERRVRETLHLGSLDLDLLENFSEVCNVAVTLLNDGSQPNLTVGQVLEAPPAADSAIARVVQDASERLEIEVTVDGYPSGKVALLAM